MLSVCGLALWLRPNGESAPAQPARLLQQGNADLATAIQTAQQHVNGKAVNADVLSPAWQTGGTEQLKFAITCVTDNQLQTTADGQTGRVDHVRPAMTGRMGMGMGMGGFQPSGYWQLQYGQPQQGQPNTGSPHPYQQQYQQHPDAASNRTAVGREPRLAQGQPLRQRWQAAVTVSPQPGYWHGPRLAVTPAGPHRQFQPLRCRSRGARSGIRRKVTRPSITSVYTVTRRPVQMGGMSMMVMHRRAPASSLATV